MARQAQKPTAPERNRSIKERVRRKEIEYIPTSTAGGGGSDSFSYGRFRHVAAGDNMTPVLGQFFVDWALWEPAGVLTGDYAVVDYDTGFGTVKAIQTPGPGLYSVSWQGASYINPTGTDEEILLRVSLFPAVTTDQAKFDNVVNTLNTDDYFTFTHAGLLWVPNDTHYIATAAAGAGSLSITNMPYLETHYLNVAKVGNGV